MNLLHPHTSLSLIRFLLATPVMRVGKAGWPL